MRANLDGFQGNSRHIQQRFAHKEEFFCADAHHQHLKQTGNFLVFRLFVARHLLSNGKTVGLRDFLRDIIWIRGNVENFKENLGERFSKLVC